MLPEDLQGESGVDGRGGGVVRVAQRVAALVVLRRMHHLWGLGGGLSLGGYGFAVRGLCFVVQGFAAARAAHHVVAAEGAKVGVEECVTRQPADAAVPRLRGHLRRGLWLLCWGVVGVMLGVCGCDARGLWL